MPNITYVSLVITAYLLGFSALAGVAGMAVNKIMRKYHFRER
jgi:hypothetical protein